MMSIKKILNKKTWTGRELGILALTDMAVNFQRMMEGKKDEPLVPREQIQSMVNSIDDRSEIRIYNGYISIYNWLSVRFNIAQTQFQQAQLNFNSLLSYILDAQLVEGVYSYIAKLPVIMTQKQYDDIKTKRVEEYFKDNDGEELASGILDLVTRAIEYYLNLLKKEPNKQNPLKSIRKKYINKPIKSKYILSNWNEILEEGYYTIEDGSGRRSDKMSQEEWEKTIEPAIAEYGKKEGGIDRISMERFIDRAKVIFAGGTEKDADEAQKKKDIEAGRSLPVQWHTYETPPDDLTKWDFIEQDLIREFYPADLDGSGNPWSEKNFLESVKDFYNEFKELVDAMLKDMDKRYFKNNDIKMSKLPIEKWDTTIFSWRDLYDVDFYGEKSKANGDFHVFDGNRRALFNGIAILRPSDLLDKSIRIDKNGYYIEPNAKTSIEEMSGLERFFQETEQYAENVKRLEETRKTLVSSFYYMKGYNYALDIISDEFEIPNISIFKTPVEQFEKRIDALNDSIHILYQRIKNTDYGDKDLQTKKLQVLQDFFQPIDRASLAISEENKKEAKNLLKNFNAFKDEYKETFERLLCELPNTDAEAC